jgi:hypothetical protein
MACLYDEGKEPSAKQRLTSVVIGIKRASRQDLSKVVGIISSEHVESEEFKIAFLTSSGVAGERQLSRGGGVCG